MVAAQLVEFAAVYHTWLVRHPIITKCVSSAVIGATGDTISQALSWHLHGPRPFDPKRLARYTLFGMIFFTPLQHHIYRVMDSNFPGTSTRTVLAKTLFDQMVLAPTCMAYFFVGLGLLEGSSWSTIKQKFAQDFVPALKANYLVWPIAQYLNFRLVPPHYRILYVNIIALGWTVYIAGLLAKPVPRKEPVEVNLKIE